MNNSILISLDKHFAEEYFYIAHLLDRVLIGKANEENYDKLIKALKSDEVLELHLFNEKREIFASRTDGELTEYEPLLHNECYEIDSVITRCYELDPGLLKSNGVSYDGLEVKEYISYDENHMAYVDKTILYRFIERSKLDGESK